MDLINLLPVTEQLSPVLLIFTLLQSSLCGHLTQAGEEVLVGLMHESGCVCVMIGQ